MLSNWYHDGQWSPGVSTLEAYRNFNNNRLLVNWYWHTHHGMVLTAFSLLLTQSSVEGTIDSLANLTDEWLLFLQRSTMRGFNAFAYMQIKTQKVLPVLYICICANENALWIPTCPSVRPSVRRSVPKFVLFNHGTKPEGISPGTSEFWSHPKIFPPCPVTSTTVSVASGSLIRFPPSLFHFFAYQFLGTTSYPECNLRKRMMPTIY